MRSLFLLLTPFLASAGDPTYELIAPIGTLPEKVTLETYLSGMYTTVIGIAGILAVLMLVICGIKLMGSGGAQGKSEARQCITNAILGLLLAIGSWILLYTINPELVGTDAKLAVNVPSAPPSAEKIVSTTTFVPNARTDGFSCSASDTLGCVTTNFPIERILPYSHTPTPEKVTAFGFSTPGAGAFKGTITATAADLATLGKLLIISEIAGDTATFGKYPACVAQGDDTSIIKYSMDPSANPDTYCILKPDTRYYINVVNLEKGTTNPTCTDVASCTFSLWTNNEKVAVVTKGGSCGSTTCTLRDPGKGLWSPDVNAAVPVYVVDQSTNNGEPASWTGISGCVNGGSVDSYDAPCLTSVYTGKIDGKTVTISSRPGYILSIRYFVDHTKTLDKSNGRFKLETLIGGNIAGAGVKMTLTPTPGDMNPVNSRCATESTMTPSISVGNGPFGCSIDTTRDIYYLNIQFKGNYSYPLFLDEGVTLFHPGTVTLPNGQCLKTGGGDCGSTTCTLRDPGKGLWSPDVNAAVPVYVADQSTNEGNPTSITSVPGCINGASIDNAGTCRKSTSYSGSISGKTVSITSKPGHILSIRYFVDHTKKQKAYSGDFNLTNAVGGNTGPMTISLSATPGDMNPSNPQCVVADAGTPFLRVGTDYCPIDMARDIYYLNIRFDFDRSGAIGGLILTEPRPDVSVFHPGTVTLPNGQCLKTGGAAVDPGKGLWSPNLKAATPVYVIDKTWGSLGVLSGCIMGVRPDAPVWYYESACAQNPSYTGKIDGKTVTISNKPGHILSIRYHVDESGWTPSASARFDLQNAIGGNIGGVGVTMTFTETPGDMNPANPRCKSVSAMVPSISAYSIDDPRTKKFPFPCAIDKTKKIYYLNFRFEGNYGSVYLGDSAGLMFNQASYE